MRVAILGLDGIPFDFIISLARTGHMPNIRKVLNNGVYGILWSTVPSISPVAWASMATGLNPGKHGIFGFVDRYFRPYSSRNIMGKSIWDIASRAGKTITCLNVPFTYPAYPIRGIMISGPPSPREQIDAYPSEIIGELEALGYKLDLDIPNEEYRGLKEADFMKQAEEITRIRAEALLMLMDNVQWDLLYAVFTTPDRVQHVFFGRAIESSPFYALRDRMILIRYYELLDEIIGKVLAALPGDTIMMLVSDHGFEPLYKYIGLHNILAEFVVKKGPLRMLYEMPMRLLGKINLMSLARRTLIRLGIAGETRRLIGGGFECSLNYIYCSSERLRKRLDEIVRFLSLVTDKENGLRIFDKVHRREELFYGPFLKDAPDIILVPVSGYEPKAILPEKFMKIKLTRGVTSKTGTHMSSKARRGFFAMVGDGVIEGRRLDISIYDVAPTALHILDLPVPEDVDGDVLVQAFEKKSSVARRRVRIFKRSRREDLIPKIRKVRERLKRN